MKLGATDGLSVALVTFLKDRTGGSRPARRHNFVRQQKYAKMLPPCGGHLLCRISVASTNNNAQKVGLLQGASKSGVYRQKNEKTSILKLPIGRGSQEPRGLRGNSVLHILCKHA